MSGYTTRKLYVPPLLWLVALAILYHSGCVSAARRQEAPSVMDPCSVTCQTTVLGPCRAKCQAFDVECQTKCRKKFIKCLEECHAKLEKEKKHD